MIDKYIAEKKHLARNAKCFILESVPTTGTRVLHLKSESKKPLFANHKLVSAEIDNNQLCLNFSPKETNP